LDPLELLRGRNRFNVKAPSGLWYTIRLPRVEECMAAGGVPLPLVVKVQAELLATAAQVAGREQESEPPEPPEITQDERERMIAYQNELVRQSVMRVAETEEGLEEQDEIESTLELVREIPEEDWHQIVLWAGRDVPVPKAGGSTLPDSPASSSAPLDGSTPESSGSGDETPAETSPTT